MTTNTTTSGFCCDEYAAMHRAAHGPASVSRRGLLGGALALAGTTTVLGSSVVTASPARAESASSVLVVVSLRGAADGLSLVVPHGDPAYAAARPTIAIPRESLLVPDGFFGLHPAMDDLLPLWNEGKVAAVHATGLPVANRSHFAAMEEMEDADPGSSARVGWLNRLVGGTPGGSPLQGFSVGSTIPTSLVGPTSAMSAGSVGDVQLPGDDSEGRRRASLGILWNRERSTLGKSMRTTFDAISAFGPAKSAEDHRSTYPGTGLGRSLSTAAQIIRGDVGVEVITVDQGDWDMHTDMGTVGGGWMRNNAGDLASSMAAFFADLGTQRDKVTLVTLSEFGRRVAENDSGGTDHGYGNVMFVAGAGVRPGYHARWPGLATGYEADLTVTTDYRQVLADVVSRRFGASVASVFPGLKYQSTGVMA
ncbi:DUF1501 domain-containing protein [Nocardioides anomalus]|uniref:DUF1501 domain-containing protein n=1 Tax=Nocardioides anomalus TaxID=2712223 RepID=A0A6G6WD93_9ACTN|nr:DUF1501 domain-containing protein [Nocardioides anomalus]QIG43298.1 DUF1501 domain-containing protein [Nocardioides anomalus]